MPPGLFPFPLPGGSPYAFVARAAACGAPITFADTCYTCTAKEEHGTYARYTLRRLADGAEATYDLDLTGDYQQKNLATVRTAVDLLRNGSPFVPGDEALHTGLRHAAASTGLRGRWQVIGQAPLTVADGGHNPAGLTETMRQLAACRYDRLYMIVGFAADKDLEHILAMLPTEAYYFFTQADSRLLTEIPVGRKRATVVTSHPEDTYQLVTDADKLVEKLQITDPVRFWESSRILIVSYK